MKNDLTTNEIEAIKINQDIIKRMAENSAKTKSIFLAIFTAIITFHKSFTIDGFVFLGLLSVILSFWYSDAKYLQLERAFRKHHYNILHENKNNPLSKWEFNPNKYKPEEHIFKTMFMNFTMWIYWVASLLLLKFALID